MSQWGMKNYFLNIFFSNIKPFQCSLNNIFSEKRKKKNKKKYSQKKYNLYNVHPLWIYCINITGNK